MQLMSNNVLYLANSKYINQLKSSLHVLYHRTFHPDLLTVSEEKHFIGSGKSIRDHWAIALSWFLWFLSLEIIVSLTKSKCNYKGKKIVKHYPLKSEGKKQAETKQRRKKKQISRYLYFGSLYTIANRLYLICSIEQLPLETNYTPFWESKMERRCN